MATLTAQQIAAKWARNLTNSTESIKAGVQAVTKNPMEAAAARSQQYVEGVRRAVENGKWQGGLMSMSLEEWKRRTAEMGTARIPEGVRQAEGKMVRFMQALLPVTQQVKETIAQMPKGTEADSKARMNKAFDMMKAFQYRKQRM